MFGYVV